MTEPIPVPEQTLPPQGSSIGTSAVLSEKPPGGSFVTATLQVVMITSDLRRAMSAMIKLGIGPWMVHTLGPHNVEEFTYRGRPSDAIIRVAVSFVGSVMWELVQPISGVCAQRDFLERNGDGFHHVSIDCDNLDWDARVAEFERRG